MKRISRPLVMFVILYQQVCHVSMIFFSTIVLLMSGYTVDITLPLWHFNKVLSAASWTSHLVKQMGIRMNPEDSRRIHRIPRSITGEPRRIMTNLGYVETIRKMLKLHPPIWCWNLFCFGLSLGDGMWFKWLSSPSDHLSKQQLLAGNLAISDPRFQGWVLQVEGIQKRLLCLGKIIHVTAGTLTLIM